MIVTVGRLPVLVLLGSTAQGVAQTCEIAIRNTTDIMLSVTIHDNKGNKLSDETTFAPPDEEEVMVISLVAGQCSNATFAIMKDLKRNESYLVPLELDGNPPTHDIWLGDLASRNRLRNH